MSFLVIILPAALSGAALGTAIYANHRLRVQWDLAHRRELLLGQLVGEAGEALMSGMEFDEFCALWDRHILPFVDECYNQSRHARDFWQRVPEFGKPWKDFEPAPTMKEAP